MKVDSHLLFLLLLCWIVRQRNSIGIAAHSRQCCAEPLNLINNYQTAVLENSLHQLEYVICTSNDIEIKEQSQVFRLLAILALDSKLNFQELAGAGNHNLESFD